MNDDFLARTSVLDLGRWYAAPLAARLLGDFGAEVIRVEPPEGDPTRAEGPFPPGFEGRPDHSGVYHYFNGGKLGVTLDVASERGRGLLGELIARADVVVSDRLPAEARALRLTWDDVREVNPNAVLLSITPWGLDGPYCDYRAYPMNELHASGAAYALGVPDQEPITLPGPQSSYLAGANGAGAAVTALYARDITGEGQLVDISTIETVVTVLMGHAVVKAHHLGERTMRTGHRLAGMAPHTHFPCKDGYFCVIGTQPPHWERLKDALGRPDWAESELFANARSRYRYVEDFEALLIDELSKRSKEEWFDVFWERRAPGMPLNTVADVMEMEHLAARGFFKSVEIAPGFEARVPGAPFLFDGRDRPSARPAPALGEHNDEVFARPPQGRPPTIVARDAPEEEVARGRPLDGVRVVEFCWVLAGPLVGQMLADLGAEVIKVEHPYRPDIQRAMFPFLGEPSPNNSVSFNTLHRGKQAVAVDMGNEAGAEAVRDLVAVSDVVIENLSPRVLAGFGLGYDDLKRVRPDLVMASMTAAGHTGPLAGMIGYGPSTGALAGFEGLVGYPGGPPLGAQQITYGDPVVASFTASAVAAALHRRRRTGQGVHIDVSQIEVTVAAMGHQVLDSGIAGALPERAGNRHPRMAPHGCYPCSGDDEWVSIAAGSDAEWRALAAVIGEPWAAEARFADLEGRKRQEDELDRLIGEWTRSRTKYEVTETLQAAGVAALPTLNTLDLPSDPHLQARGVYPAGGHPHLPPAGFARGAWNLKGTPPSVAARAPFAAEHDRGVFVGLLGKSPQEYHRLTTGGAVVEAANLSWDMRFLGSKE